MNSTRRLQPYRGTLRKGQGPLSSTHDYVPHRNRNKRGSLLFMNMGEWAARDKRTSISQLEMGKSMGQLLSHALFKPQTDKRGVREKRDTLLLKRDSVLDEEVATSVLKHQLDFFWDVGAGWDLLVVFLVALFQTLWVTQTSYGQLVGPFLSKSKVVILTR